MHWTPAGLRSMDPDDNDEQRSGNVSNGIREKHAYISLPEASNGKQKDVKIPIPRTPTERDRVNSYLILESWYEISGRNFHNAEEIYTNLNHGDCNNTTRIDCWNLR